MDLKYPDREIKFHGKTYTLYDICKGNNDTKNTLKNLVKEGYKVLIKKTRTKYSNAVYLEV